MDLLPIFLNIRDKKCVVVGGGGVAFRKATLLLRAGADLSIVAPSVSDELRNLCAAHDCTIIERKFEEADLSDAAIVVAATDDLQTNEQVSVISSALNIPVNVVDQPHLCSFIMPSIVDRSPVVVAISSGGSSPILTRKLKELNETMMPGRIGKLAELLGSYRDRVRNEIGDFSERIRFWESVLDSEIPELVYNGQDDKARSALDTWLTNPEIDRIGGEVYLVGAGPGDPDLLTLRALRLMHKADVVLYDRLVSPEILLKLRPDAEKIYVGKRSADHAVPQETINEMLVRLAKEGRRVLRLKGGDPFIFGRGGEELESLAAAGIPFQIVPGITAASGCASYAGIPLTHRDYSQSVRFLTGHTKDGRVPLEWDVLVKEQQTLVFYMGLAGLPLICDQLMNHGMSSTTPVAVVQQGTTQTQKVVVGTLESIADLAAEKEIQAPTIIIIGEVVKLQQSLSWFNEN
ncbi:MAG: uroporphyrinogen-III C-methyltransferase [SAR86 cluster bacterium]|uniref:Siroheme synthase n=1 Tax=SAR86 cluster bacterium TaxID=2030880 RepID=A0A2A4X0Z3_9GAMM|nr:MAG: uroporphyrinogen-III C-methyltransferase [SAR86 cluster bacterium]